MDEYDVHKGGPHNLSFNKPRGGLHATTIYPIYIRVAPENMDACLGQQPCPIVIRFVNLRRATVVRMAPSDCWRPRGTGRVETPHGFQAKPFTASQYHSIRVRDLLPGRRDSGPLRCLQQLRRRADRSCSGRTGHARIDPGDSRVLGRSHGRFVGGSSRTPFGSLVPHHLRRRLHCLWLRRNRFCAHCLFVSVEHRLSCLDANCYQHGPGFGSSR